MGRKRKSAVYTFFSYDKEANVSTCLVCSSNIKGQHGTNLLYHLSCKHQNEYNTVKSHNQLNSSEVLNDENGEIQGLKTDKITTEQALQSQQSNEIPPKKKKITPTEDLVAATTSAFKTQESQDTGGDVILKYWATKLNRLAPDQRRYAEKIINDVLFEGEMGTLTRNGVRFLTVGSTSHAVSPSPDPLLTYSLSAPSNLRDPKLEMSRSPSPNHC